MFVSTLVSNGGSGLEGTVNWASVVTTGCSSREIDLSLSWHNGKSIAIPVVGLGVGSGGRISRSAGCNVHSTEVLLGYMPVVV